MHKYLLEIPEGFETARLILRKYRVGDGKWYYPMCIKNHDHLLRYEGENPAVNVKNEDEAEILVRDYAATWVGRKCFFLGVFEKTSGDFVAQVYIGVVNWELPEFEVGYFADCDHEGLGFVGEAVKGSLEFIFEHLQARRVRLETDDTNLRSQRVAERCGMIREGHFRENKINSDGSVSGTLFYGILRTEI